MAAKLPTQKPRLAGTWALVTGASSGIGRATALKLAAEGASLILAARREDRLQQVAKDALTAGSPRVEVVVADLASPAGVEALASRTLQLLADSGLPLSVLLNNSGMAGTIAGQTALAGDPDEWDTMIALNLSAPMRLTRRLAPAMVERGSGTIVNIASTAGVGVMPGLAAYSSTKWGLRGWSRCTHADLSGKGVRSVVINPAGVATEMTAAVADEMGINMDALITADDIAETVLLAVRLSPAATPEEITVRNMGAGMWKEKK